MLNVGIIGLGMIGESMLREFINHPSFDVHTVWDIDEVINLRVSDRYPSVGIAGDATELIEDPQVEVVYIATPPTTHIEYGWKVVRAGKVLFCEKPLALDLTESHGLVDFVDRKKLVTAMNFIPDSSCGDYRKRGQWAGSAEGWPRRPQIPSSAPPP